MGQQVQDLINKIKTEGVQQAEQKAQEITALANKKAEQIISEAQEKGRRVISEAQAEAQKTKEATHAALKQAARDMLLTLREEINKTLQRIVSQETRSSLSPENLSGIIAGAVKSYLTQEAGEVDIRVAVNDQDLQKFKDGFIKKLQEEIKKPIQFQSDEIEKGFSISFDGGKSCFDFTDSSLVKFLSGYLNAEMTSLLEETVSSKK
ncbi:MAG: hypothetical protein WC552_07465 [Candidatus Omnitrophota bacterium]